MRSKRWNFEDGTIGSWVYESSLPRVIEASATHAIGNYALHVASAATVPTSIWSHPVEDGFAVGPGETVNADYWIYPLGPATTDGWLTLQWLNAAGTEISRSQGPQQNFTTALDDRWYYLNLSATAPAGVDRVRLGWVTNADMVSGEHVWIDEASIAVPPKPTFWRPSTADILDLSGVPRRFDDFEFELVDRRNRKLGVVHPDLSKNPTVNWDTSRAVHRSLTGFYLDHVENQYVNPITDRVRVWMRLQNGVRYSLGVFMWAESETPLRPWGYERTGTLLDKTHILDQPMQAAKSLPRHASVLAYAQEILDTIPEFRDLAVIDPDWMSDLENAGLWYATNLLGLEAIGREANSPVSWQPGTHILKFLNDMMALVTYLPVHCDRNGTLILTDAEPITNRPIEHRYDDGDPRIIEDSVRRPDSLVSAPNLVVVYDTATNQSPIRGLWRAPTSAPYSESSRGGVRVTKFVPRAGLGNAAEANREARRVAEWLVKAGNWVEWDTTADPRHDAYDIVVVHGERFVETAWSLPCVAGSPMTHRALKVYMEDDNEFR